jgi:hypothetical protein
MFQYLCERGSIMRDISKVYSWGDFVAFVLEEYKPDDEGGSHPILDQVAADLHSGDLQRRNGHGDPIQPWKSPAELHATYLLPIEVDELSIMKSWRLSWVATIKLGPQLTATQEYKQFGWKGALQLEAKRLRANRKKVGLSISNTDLSTLLAKYAADNNIKTVQGKAPNSEYIRSYVLANRKVNNPAINTSKQ